MHGNEFFKELVFRSKETDKFKAARLFYSLFFKIATGNEPTNSHGDIWTFPDSIMVECKKITPQEHACVRQFLTNHLLLEEFHAEPGGTLYTAVGNPTQTVQSIFWYIKTDAAINKILPLVGFKPQTTRSNHNGLAFFSHAEEHSEKELLRKTRDNHLKSSSA